LGAQLSHRTSVHNGDFVAALDFSSNLLGAYLYWYNIQCQNVASDVTVPAPLHNNSSESFSSRRIP